MNKQGKVLLIGFLVIVIFFFIPLNYYLIAPGEVFNLKDIVLVPTVQEKNHLYAPSVAVYENKYFAMINTTLFNKLNTNLFYLIYAGLSPSIEAEKLSDFLPKGTTSEQYEAAMLAATNISVSNLKYVVAARVNKTVDELNFTINVSAEGPSVAVAFALEAINQLQEEDMTQGLKIGAVGNIDREGKVFPVGAVKQKIIAAERAQVDLLFIPLKDYTDEIKKRESRITVVPIATIDEAVEYLNKKKKEE